jgi:Pentapeptide repeats (8 copies)
MKPINPLPVRKSLGKLTQAELYAQVKDSTERNRQFFFIWIAFALYVIVTTVATSDLQLLLPNSTVTLPALGIQLPLIGFFLVTPWLVLILHFNLLQNLDSHGNKLMQWANTYPNQTPPRTALPAFLFDFAMLEQGGVFTKLTQIATQLVCYAAGPITIGILLWRFSDYQSWQYTISQFIAFVCCGYLVATATMTLVQKHRLKVAFSRFSYFLVYVPIILVVSLQTYWVVALALQSSKPMWFSERYPEILLPRISVPPNTSLVSFPTDMPTRMALDGEKDTTEWWKKFGLSANLEGRSLKYARMVFVDLRRVNLEKTELQDADLKGSQLQGANLQFASLLYTDLSEVHLQDSKLMGSQLQGAKLYGANLQRADLYGANLQNAALVNAQLQATEFIKTDLRGAMFVGANLKGANLSSIIVNARTTFEYSNSDELTQVIVGENEDFEPKKIVVNLGKTWIFREQLLANNKLILPDILYKQLFANPTEHISINSAGKFLNETGVGLRIPSNK